MYIIYVSRSESAYHLSHHPSLCLVCNIWTQADMLSEAVKFGHVRRIVTPEGPYYEGSVAVVFGTTADAQKCAQAMHGRFFDGRMIEVRHMIRIPYA